MLYVPNVIIGTAAVAVGSSAHVGLATFSSFTVFGGDIPALPVLAAVPSPPLGPVWVALLIVAAAAAVAAGPAVRAPRRCRCWLRWQAGRCRSARGLGMALLGFAAGGRLGNFGDVGVDQATFAPAVFVWFVGIGALTVVMTGGICATAEADQARHPRPELGRGRARRRASPQRSSRTSRRTSPRTTSRPPSTTCRRRREEEYPHSTSADPEDHFVADDDATPGTTPGGKSETAE